MSHRDDELKKFALDAALDLRATDQHVGVLDTAKKFYDWLTEDDRSEQRGKGAEHVS